MSTLSPQKTANDYIYDNIDKSIKISKKEIKYFWNKFALLKEQKNNMGLFSFMKRHLSSSSKEVSSL